MKWKTRIGLWNVRKLRECGKLKEVEKEMTRYKLDSMGLSETLWKGNGEIITENGNFLKFSGVGEDIKHGNCVSIVMTKEG